MNWPEKIFIVDDNPDKVERFARSLRNISWVIRDFTYSNRDIKYDERALQDFEENHGELSDYVPHQLKRLAEENGERFEDDVEELVVQSKENVVDAIEGLSTPGPAMAFIDFHFEDGASDDATDDLKERYSGSPRSSPNEYEGVPEQWNLASGTSFQQPGCVFAAHFQPDVGPPLRVMVPSTAAWPNEKPVHNKAVTTDQEARTGDSAIWRAILLGFNKWIELQRLVPPPWNSTKHWFSTNELNSDGLPDEDHMPHDLDVLPKKESGDIRFEEYREVVEDAFDLTLPRSWWSSESSLRALHNCLKGLCGAYYCGTPTEENSYNLRIGSVLLIALLAMRESSPDYSEWAEQIDPEDLVGMDEAKLLPRQPPDEAKNTARALYYLFENLFRSDPEHQTPSGDLPKVVGMGLKDDGRHLYFEFNWLANEAPDDERSFAEQVREHDFDMPPLKGTVEAKNTVASLGSLWSGLLRSSEGFGAPGTVWMEGNSLHIASTQ